MLSPITSPASFGRVALIAVTTAALVVGALVSEAPPRAIAADDPIPGIVGAQTTTRTSPNATPDVTNASLMGNGDALVSTFGGPVSLGYDISKVDFWKDGSRNPATGAVTNSTPLRAGQVVVTIPSLDGASYSQQQDQYNAEVRSTFTTSTTSITQRARVLATSENVLATDLTNNSSVAVQVSVATAANTSFAANGATTSAGISGDVAWATRTGPTGLGDGPDGNAFRMRAALATRVIGASATVTTDGAAVSTSAFSIPAGATVTVATQIGSTGGDVLTNTPADPVPAATSAAASLTSATLASFDTAHRLWWSDFWHASSVQLSGEPLLMRYYYGSLYILASSNREGKFAPGLYGWNGADDLKWQGDYTTNYNIQSPYYGVYSSNHPELARSYYKTITSISDEHGEQYAAARGFQGTYFLTHYGPLGIRTEARGNPDWGQRTNALESSINFLKDYQYTLDADLLQSTSYPFLIEVADFWDAYLVKDAGGRYVVNDSAVAESDYAHNMNPTTALAYLRQFYSGMLTVSTDLGVDQARRAKWQDIRDNLSAYTTLQYGGKTVFSFSEKNPSAEANSYPYNLYPVHPADQVGESSPLAAVARATISTRPSYWAQQNAFAQVYPAAVKSGYPATEVVAKMNGILGRLGANNFFKQGGGGLETVGSIETINSMLLSSTDGAIRVFPNWTGKDASYTSLRAVGAFTVSASMTGGVVQSVSITSEKGKDVTVRNPWPGKDLIVTKVGGGAVSTTRVAGDYRFATVASGQYTLAPLGGTPTAPNYSLAVNADATATSTVDANGWRTSAVVDGDPRSTVASRGWSSSNSTATNHSEALTIDLRSTKLVSRVDLTPRNDSGNVGAGYPIDLDVSVSLDGTTWSSVSTAIGVARPTTATPIAYSFTPQNAQYIRITGTNLRPNSSDGGKYRMQFAEVGAFGAITTPKTATASSSVESGGWGVARVVNGTTQSAGDDLGWTSSSSLTSNHTESVTVDLLSTRSLTSVVLHPRTDGSNAGQGFPIDYSIAISTDGTAWTTVATRTAQPAATSPQTATFAASSARFVKVTGTNLRPNPNDRNQYRMQLAEVSVFGN